MAFKLVRRHHTKWPTDRKTQETPPCLRQLAACLLSLLVTSLDCLRATVAGGLLLPILYRMLPRRPGGTTGDAPGAGIEPGKPNKLDRIW